MTTALQKILEQAEQLTPTQQEALAAEFRLVLAAFLEEQEGRDPLQEPRYLTFEQFFHELGMTDEQIADARQQGVGRSSCMALALTQTSSISFGDTSVGMKF